MKEVTLSTTFSTNKPEVAVAMLREYFDARYEIIAMNDKSVRYYHNFTISLAYNNDQTAWAILESAYNHVYKYMLSEHNCPVMFMGATCWAMTRI
jgi:hypothetical protein